MVEALSCVVKSMSDYQLLVVSPKAGLAWITDDRPLCEDWYGFPIPQNLSDSEEAELILLGIKYAKKVAALQDASEERNDIDLKIKAFKKKASK